MADAESVTALIAQRNARDQNASQRLWERYLARPASISGEELPEAAGGNAGKDEVLAAAFARSFRSAREGRFPQPQHRDQDWQAPTMLAASKSVGHRRDLLAARRPGGAVRGEPALAGGLGQLVCGAPTAEFIAACGEQFVSPSASRERWALGRSTLLKLLARSIREIGNCLAASPCSSEGARGAIRRTRREAAP